MSSLNIGAAAAALAETLPLGATATHAANQITGITAPKLAGEVEMDAARGRVLFAEKGCVACHKVKGIGGEDAAPLDAGTMDDGMNPFELAAKVWNNAQYMIEEQEAELGGQIYFSGQELANIVAFLHDSAEQALFTEESLPEKIRENLEHEHHEEREEYHE